MTTMRQKVLTFTYTTSLHVIKRLTCTYDVTMGQKVLSLLTGSLHVIKRLTSTYDVTMRQKVHSFTNVIAFNPIEFMSFS